MKMRNFKLVVALMVLSAACFAQVNGKFKNITAGSGVTCPAGAPSGSVCMNGSAYVPVLISALPSASTATNVVMMVSDGATGSDCTTGGGSFRVLCVSNGTTWGASSSVVSALGDSSITTDGYQVFSNGLVIEWMTGTTESGSTETTTTYTLPYPLTSACLNSQVSMKIASSSSSIDSWYQIISCTTTQIVIQRQGAPSGQWNVATTPLIFIIGK